MKDRTVKNPFFCLLFIPDSSPFFAKRLAVSLTIVRASVGGALTTPTRHGWPNTRRNWTWWSICSCKFFHSYALGDTIVRMRACVSSFRGSTISVSWPSLVWLSIGRTTMNSTTFALWNRERTHVQGTDCLRIVFFLYSLCFMYSSALYLAKVRSFCKLLHFVHSRSNAF